MKFSVSKILTVILLNVFFSNTYALWLCSVSDKGGHTWESKGKTVDNALAVAQSFCESFSPHGKSCHKKQCLES